MDQKKKKALIKWIDALSDKKVSSLQDLQDGAVLVSVLSVHGDNCLPNEDFDTPEKRMHAIKKYVEAFYHQPLGGSVIDFDVLLRGCVPPDVFEMEMGKLLLALLGCVVQDKCRERFIHPALNMEECYQFELKEMIEAVLFTDEAGTQITTDFYAVLKRKSDASAHLDAAFFFKLVADGTSSPKMNHGTPSGKNKLPQRSEHSPQAYAMYTNSPQHGNTSGINIRDISSPLRIMSLSSPVTPLGALMHSPQLAQKALLRQKVQECKRMEVELQNEQHLRSELEMDLKERSSKIEEKDARLRDLERQLSEVRWMRDQLDELELLRTEKERLNSENSKLQTRLSKYQDLKGHNVVLEKENKEMQSEVQKSRNELKFLEAEKESYEDFKVRYRKQQLDMSEQEAILQHRLQEIEQLTRSLEETRNMYQVAQGQCITLKKENQELEEMVGSAHGERGVGLEGAVYVGESMGIVTDKKLSELQTEYDYMKDNWIEPAHYQTVLKDLEMERESKATYEKHFVEIKQKLMCAEDDNEQLKYKLNEQAAGISELETSLQSTRGQECELRKQLSELESTCDCLKKSEDGLLKKIKHLEDSVLAVEKELSSTQTELKLTKKETEVHIGASENRRLTILQLDSEKLQKHQAEQRLSAEVHTWTMKAEELKNKLKTQKEESQRLEESLKEKLVSLQADLDKIEVELKNEQCEKEMTEKTLTEKIESLESGNAELSEKLEMEKKNLNKKISELESEVSAEISCKEESVGSLKLLTKEYEAYQISSKEKEESVLNELRALQKDKQDVDLELHRHKCEIKSLSQSYEDRCKKMESKHEENVKTWRKEVDSFKLKQEESGKVQTNLKEDLSESKLSVQKLKLEEKRLNELVQKTRSENAELVDSFEKCKMTLIEYEYELKTCKDTLTNDREQFSVLLKEKDAIITSVQFQYESEVEQYKKDRLQLMDQINVLEKSIEVEKRKFSDTELNMKKTFSEDESKLFSQIKQLELEKKELMASHEIYVSELKSLSEENDKVWKDKLSVLEKKIEEKESEWFKLDCDNKEQGKQIATMTKELHEAEKKQNSYVSDINDAYTAWKEDKDKLKKEHESEIQTLKSTQQDKIEEYENRILSLQKRVEEIETESSKIQEELKKTNNDTENKFQLTLGESQKLMGNIDVLESEKEAFTSEIGRYKSLLRGSESKISQLNARIEDLENKLKRMNQSRADLECQFTETKEMSNNSLSELKDRMKNLTEEKSQTETSFEEYKVKMEAEQSEMKTKLGETESYWQAQCLQLEEEYSRGAQEQKEEVRVQLVEMESNYESQLQNLTEEKDALHATEILTYKDMVASLEKVVSEQKDEIDSVVSVKNSQVADYERKLTDLSAVVVKYKDSCAELSGETEILKVKCKKLEEQKAEKIEMLIGEYETQIAELKTSLTLSQEEAFENLKKEHAERVSKLESDLDEQRVSYQKMISDMQEKLGGETFDLRERLSQMKCQYETLIETKEKDTKQKVIELENKIKSLENDTASLQVTITSEKSDSAQKQNDLSELLTKNKELESIIEKAKAEHMEMEKQLVTSMGSVNNLQSQLTSVQDELGVTGESVMKEKGAKEEVERQLEYTRDRNDTLTAELSSQQQQLAAVEEEKRILEVEINKNKNVMEEVKQQSDKDLRFRDIEKQELERQLQSSQKCYEAVQKAQTELEGQVERMGQDRVQLETRNRELEQRIYNYLDREKKMMEDNQHQINIAAELNATLRKQLEEKATEIRGINEKFNKEMEMTMVQFNQMKSRFETDMKTLNEEKTAVEVEVASLQPMQQKVKELEAERKKLQDINDKYNIHYNKKKEVIVQLTEELKAKEKELESLKQTEGRLVEEVAPLREKLDSEIMKNKSLGCKMRSLEAENDLADRKIRELKRRVQDKENAHFGDSTHFMNMLKARENSEDASFMESHPGTIPMNDFNSERESISDYTLTPKERESRGTKRMSKSVSSTQVSKEIHNDMNADTVSIGSATSLAYRLRSRESTASLNKSIASFDSWKSNSSVPRGTGRVFHCEDEPMEFEWGRLGELQRRNTLCPAHLKTSYPVETQTYRPNKFRDDALRESTMGNNTILQADAGSGRKRKKTVDTDSSGGESSDSLKSKLAKTGCVYQKPGPPTPANSRRSSKGSRSPGGRLSSGKLSKSPKTPVQVRGKKTPKRTPRNTPKRSAIDVDGNGSAKKLGKRDSVAFNVGFSPLSMHKSSRLTRQQAFIQKQPQSSGQMPPPKRKPLGIRNFLQTGL